MCIRDRDVNPGSVTFDQDSFINGKASVELEYDAVAEPTYTITIPMGVQLVKGGTTSTFKAEGISNLNGGKIVLSITSTRKSGMPDDCPDFALYRGHNYVPYEVQGFYKDGTSHFVSELNKEVMSFDAVSYTHLDVYKRQGIPSGRLRDAGRNVHPGLILHHGRRLHIPHSPDRPARGPYTSFCRRSPGRCPAG